MEGIVTCVWCLVSGLSEIGADGIVAVAVECRSVRVPLPGRSHWSERRTLCRELGFMARYPWTSIVTKTRQRAVVRTQDDPDVFRSPRRLTGLFLMPAILTGRMELLLKPVDLVWWIGMLIGFSRPLKAMPKSSRHICNPMRTLAVAELECFDAGASPKVRLTNFVSRNSTPSCQV